MIDWYRKMVAEYEKRLSEAIKSKNQKEIDYCLMELENYQNAVSRSSK